MKNNNQNKKLILEQLKKTPIVEAACQLVGISRMTFYRWKQNPEFAEKVDKAILEGRMLVNDLAESQLISAIKEQNLSAITYWLKHHHPSYKTKIEIEGAINAVHELSPRQQELMKKAFELSGINFNNLNNNDKETYDTRKQEPSKEKPK
ncbi:hypothetical protein C4572_00105 [Candidatus Parcubacteria bacterium]|nr:MAG: hypothetical protein C4572_00105 [Candidatus Parcubacteria bacterium]